MDMWGVSAASNLSAGTLQRAAEVNGHDTMHLQNIQTASKPCAHVQCPCQDPMIVGQPPIKWASRTIKRKRYATYPWAGRP